MLLVRKLEACLRFICRRARGKCVWHAEVATRSQGPKEMGWVTWPTKYLTANRQNFRSWRSHSLGNSSGMRSPSALIFVVWSKVDSQWRVTEHFFWNIFERGSDFESVTLRKDVAQRGLFCQWSWPYHHEPYRCKDLGVERNVQYGNFDPFRMLKIII
jgi:hypothetical protein